MKVSEAFELYRQDVIIFRDQSRRTEEHYDMFCRSLVDFWGDEDICKLDFRTIREWKKTLDDTKVSATVRNYLGGLRNVLKFLRKKKYDVLDPDLIDLPKRKDKKIIYLTEEEVQALIDACTKPRSKAIIAMFYASGIRLSELISLDRSDLNEKTKSFSVVGKNDKSRLCFFDDRALRYIKQYLATRNDNHPALFLCEQRIGRMTATNIQFIMKAARKRAGIVKLVTPHILRHSYATNLLHNNCNIRNVQVMLGHANIMTTMRYTHVVDEDLRKAYLQFHTV